MTLKLLDRKVVFECKPFKVEELHLSHDGKPYEHSWHRLTAPDWANVLPVTADGKAILIRQPRAGIVKEILETPGGELDPSEKDPTMAAARELEEETGFTSQRILSLGHFNPNPAIMSNRIHFFLALGCVPAMNRQHFPDASERIKLEAVDVKELDQMVRTGQIEHVLSATCILLAQKYLKV